MGEGWWSGKGAEGTGEYKRRSTMSIRSFCGWKILSSMVERCPTKIEKGLIATLFETGGRASEVLSLEGAQFHDKGKYILITGMLVLKQRDIGQSYRQVAMMKSDALVKPMMDWVGEVGEGKLFSYGYDWLYKQVIGADKDWWPHRFRGERASQLAVEHDFGVLNLMRWFGWTSEHMAAHYAKMSVKELVEKMSRGQL